VRLGACNNILQVSVTGKVMNSSDCYTQSLVSSRNIALQFKSICMVLAADGREPDSARSQTPIGRHASDGKRRTRQKHV
jgi:hypothetical protein